MILKICIAEDNYFLMKTIKEKLSFFEDISIKFTGNNGAELIGKLEENHKNLAKSWKIVKSEENRSWQTNRETHRTEITEILLCDFTAAKKRCGP